MTTDRLPGLYLHIPFCRTKCSYCDFYSVTGNGLLDRFFASLRVEAGFYKRDYSGYPGFGTLYIGGGTPSLPEAGYISGIIEHLGDLLEFEPGSEITVEVNPDDITMEKLETYIAAGVNRVSVGVQSFDDVELRFLGRRHDAEGAVKALRMIREAGFSNIGIDLIFGFHEHSLDAWARSLDKALEFSPEHMSCYQMTVMGSTPMGRMKAGGKISELPDDLQRDLFVLTNEILTSSGYIHYEISNFAKGKEYISKHNGRYWDHTDYLGLGPSAHSFLSGKRWWNISSVDGYCRLLEEGKKPVDGEEELSAGQLALESLYLGFRTRDGVPLSVIRSYCSGEEILGQLVADSIVSIDGDRVVPTLEGFLMADRLPLLFWDLSRDALPKRGLG